MRGTRAAVVLVAVALLFGCAGSPSETSGDKACTEPENPYDQGTGHYAGFEWAAEHGGNCDTASPSFNEGCEEYQTQEDEYETCESKER